MMTRHVPMTFCPSLVHGVPDTFDYAAWLRTADRGIDHGLNPDAVWRLHRRLARRDDCDLGGEG